MIPPTPPTPSQFGFSPTSGTGSSFELIPTGTLAFGIFTVKSVKLSANGGNYIEAQFTITEGPYEKRRVFTNIMDPLFAGNSESSRSMGLQALTRSFEACGLFRPEDPNTYRAFDRATIEDIALQLDGKKVAVKIKVEKGKDGYADKNAIQDYLSPNPASNGFKGWQQLTGAVSAPTGGIAKSAAPHAPGSFSTQKAAAAIANGPGWLNEAKAAAPAPAPAPVATPPAGTDQHQAAPEAAAEAIA